MNNTINIQQIEVRILSEIEISLAARVAELESILEDQRIIYRQLQHDYHKLHAAHLRLQDENWSATRRSDRLPLNRQQQVAMAAQERAAFERMEIALDAKGPAMEAEEC